MLFRFLSVGLFLLPAAGLFAQYRPADDALHIRKSESPIRIDGILDEPAWAEAQILSDFIRNFPVDTGLATARTEVWFTFDQNHLVIGAKCWQKREDYTIQSLRRDFPAGTSDALNIIIDPFKDGLNGFLFSVNPLNVQREALIDNGANLSFEWDNKWLSAVQNEAEYWTLEMAIPFKTLRYAVQEGQNVWRVNAIRTRLKSWEVSCWKRAPQQFSPNSLAFAADMVWDEEPPKPGANISLIPYVTAGYNTNTLRDEQLNVVGQEGRWTRNVGGDAKIAVTPSLNLDLTINPDFSQVEVDRQVTNLSRFQLFFPERRQFFLENRDLFATFGFPSTRPFFSRQIGLADTSAGTGPQYAQVPIVAGARLSGKLNDNWRIGLLNMQTRQLSLSGNRVLPAANFTVATIQRKVFGRSAVSAIFVDKENFIGQLDNAQKEGRQPWNRVLGLEYNLYSKDNRWEGEWYYHRSFSPDPRQRDETYAGFLNYNDRYVNVNLGYMNVGDHYTAEAGFIPRTGIQNFYPGISCTFYPKHRFINTWSVGIEGDLTYNLLFRPYDHDVFLYGNVVFKDQSSLTIGAYNRFTYLFDAFDPTNLNRPEDAPLPIGDYSYSGFGAEYVGSTSYNLQWNTTAEYGQYFNGRILNIDGEILYRLQPYGTFSMGYSFNSIALPKPYASADFWLIGPRAELAFTRKLFVSAFFQYNTQANNFNINTRIQWRFAPVSDVFLVYTDNSFAQAVPDTRVRFLSPKNKAIILKVSYWFNI